MEITLITIIFRSLALLGGVFMGIFAYQIYRMSKGGLKGWFYLALFGFSLFFWAMSALATKIIGITLLERLSGILGLSAMAIFVPLAYTKMVEELDLPRPAWLTARTSVIFTVTVFILILIRNVFMEGFMDQLLYKILSISHFTLAIMFLFACIPTYILSKKTKRAPWIIAFAAVLIAGTSLMIGQHYDGCCGVDGHLENSAEFCGQYDLPYQRVYEMSCIEPVVKIGKVYQAFLTIGVLLLVISYFQLTRQFKALNA